MLKQSPKTITNELIGRLSLFDLDNTPSEFEAKLFAREIEQLKQINPSEAWMLQGLLYSLLGEEKETKNAFETSLSFSPQDFEAVVLNYATSLKVLGKFDDAFKVVEKHVSEESFEFVKEAYLYSIGIGLFNKANYYSKKLEKFTSHDPAYSMHIKNLSNSCGELGVTSEELHTIYLLVLNIIFKHQKIPLETSFKVNFEHGNSLILIFYVDADSDTITKIELAIAEELAKVDISSVLEQKVTPVVLKGKVNDGI